MTMAAERQEDAYISAMEEERGSPTLSLEAMRDNFSPQGEAGRQEPAMSDYNGGVASGHGEALADDPWVLKGVHIPQTVNGGRYLVFMHRLTGDVLLKRVSTGKREEKDAGPPGDSREHHDRLPGIKESTCKPTVTHEHAAHTSCPATVSGCITYNGWNISSVGNLPWWFR